MARSYNDRCSRCSLLFSLPAESVVIILTFLHVLASLTEQLVHLQVIQVPAPFTVNEVMSQVTTSPPINSSTIDLGGTGTDQQGCGNNPLHPHLKITVQVLRIFTLVISGLFTLEIICKMGYQRKRFLKDPLMIFDLLIILTSLGSEIAFFLLHDWFLCVHLAVEICSYIILLRLWRIPRVCNIRKKEYVDRLEDEMKYLRITKVEVDRNYQEIQNKYHQQTKELEQLKVQFTSVHVEGIQNHSPLQNGTGLNSIGLNNAIQQTLSDSKTQISPNNNNPAFTNGHVPRENGRLTSPSHPSDDAPDTVRAGGRSSPIVIQSDDVFMDSDGSESPVHVQKVQVQIEEVIHQNKLPSISKSVEDELRSGNTEVYVNDGYDDDDGDVNRGTYKSADGIPITEL